MKKKLSEIFQYISISYTVIIFCNAVLSIFQFGAEAGFYAKFLVEVFFLLCIFWGVEIMLGKMKRLQQMNDLAEVVLYTGIEYLLFIGFVKVFEWFPLTLQYLICYTVLFFVIELIIRRIFYHKWKSEEETLNRLIENQNQKE